MSRYISAHSPALGHDELAAVAGVFDSRWLGQGASTLAFEHALCAHLDVPHVVAVGSGTAALHLSLEALDLPEGSGVLVPSLTFVATIQAILAARLRPVFCEVVADTLQLDIDDCRRRLEGIGPGHPPVRVVLPVHFGGASCDLAELAAFAKQRDLLIVEDAAHAFGSRVDGRALGTMGIAGCFSFDPIKNITCGEGGAVATGSEALANRLRSARALGISADGWSRHTGASPWAYGVTTTGWRSHLPNMNAAIGLVQLARLPQFRARRQAIVSRYDGALAGLTGLTAVTRPCPDQCPFTYAVRVTNGARDGLIAHLRSRDIGSAVEYIPNHGQPAFAAFHVPLPTTEQLHGEILSLPLHAELLDDDVAVVIDAVTEYFHDADRS